MGGGRSGEVNGTRDRSRMCPSCGRSIGWDVQTCPYCYWAWGVTVKGTVDASEPVPGRKRALLYLGSLLVPVFGIIVGLLYVFGDDKEREHVGTMCLVLGVISLFLIPVFLAMLIYVAVLGL